MKTKAYIFHFQDDEHIIRIPTLYWRSVFDGKLPYPGYENRTAHIAMVDVGMNRNQPQNIRNVETWQCHFNEYGFINRSSWQQSAQSNIATLVQQLFSKEYLWQCRSESAMFDQHASDEGDQWHLRPAHLDRIIEQIWQ